MRTLYNQNNGKFSDYCHNKARSQLYPLMFSCDETQLSFESKQIGNGDVEGAIMDGQMGIDRIIKVTRDNPTAVKTNPTPYPVSYPIQERFRRDFNTHYADITITTWNNKTNKPSEYYKLLAGYFLYGYFSVERDCFVEAVLVSVPHLISLIDEGRIAHTPPKLHPDPEKNQDFICVKFDDLYRCGAIVKWVKDGKLVRTQEAVTITIVKSDDNIADKLKIETLKKWLRDNRLVGRVVLKATCKPRRRINSKLSELSNLLGDNDYVSYS